MTRTSGACSHPCFFSSEMSDMLHVRTPQGVCHIPLPRRAQFDLQRAQRHPQEGHHLEQRTMPGFHNSDQAHKNVHRAQQARTRESSHRAPPPRFPTTTTTTTMSSTTKRQKETVSQTGNRTPASCELFLLGLTSRNTDHYTI